MKLNYRTISFIEGILAWTLFVIIGSFLAGLSPSHFLEKIMIITLVGGVLFFSGWKIFCERESSFRNFLKRIAINLNLNFEVKSEFYPEYELKGKYDGLTLLIRVWRRGIYGGGVVWYKIRTLLSLPKTLFLEITPNYFRSKTLTGNKEFDKKFSVKTNDEKKILKFLTQDIQKKLIRFRELGWFELKLRNSELVFHHGMVLSSFEREFKVILENVIQIARKLMSIKT